MKFSRIWALGNFATGKFREFSRAGNIRESAEIREIRENFLHANISCYTVTMIGHI